jgi:uncharacterized protein YidB (DUF937 family)
MGLLDIIRGIENGPSGTPHPSPIPSASQPSGMSSMMMALLGLLAYKAVQSTPSANPGQTGDLGSVLGGIFGGHPGATAGRPSAGNPDLSSGGLGGLLGEGGLGGLLTGGLGNLIKGFQKSGHGAVAQSWISNEPNQPISPNKLEEALGGGTLDALVKHTGMSRQELLAQLSQHLPNLINQLTPQGRLPTAEEASRL